MANLSRHPLLRLDAGAPIKRKKGGGAPIPRKFDPQAQSKTGAGLKLSRLSAQLDADTPVLQIRSDPTALAPERLLVFVLTGSVLKFEKAVRLVPGLEFLGAEDLDEDELDSNPAMYLMVPSEGALKNILTLWRGWQRNGAVPRGFSAWKALLSQLKDVRPWGPQDRITAGDYEILQGEIDAGNANIRVEVELVFRRNGDQTEREARSQISDVGGRTVSAKRIVGAGYHALLADIPMIALKQALSESRRAGDGVRLGLAGSEAILQIRPQSIFHISPYEDVESGQGAASLPLNGDPIAAIFDAVPLARHPRLDGAITVDDPFDLEPLSVGERRHGTAMASAVVHGDLNHPWERALERPVYFVNMLYATADAGTPERFPDRLPADLFEIALERMKGRNDPTASHVILINASLGDPNKPFSGRMSGWARVVDYLSHHYGVLFVISAGNNTDYLEVPNVTAVDYENLQVPDRLRMTLAASASHIAFRRILAPSEAINAVTVGALHADNYIHPHPLPVYTFDVLADSGLCTVSSGLGPGLNGATKPDILAPGGRHHIRVASAGAHHRQHPLTTNAAAFAGISVAAPPPAAAMGPDAVARSIGTSVAAALVTGVAARAHEALEAAYPDFGRIPGVRRAALLKALLIHSAKWTHARDLILEVLGPADNAYRQKDNIRRYLGFGAYDPERLIDCAEDRATLWAVGSLHSDRGMRFRVPWPETMSGKLKPHGISATLAWFSPPKPGAVAYRGVRMKINEPVQLGEAGVAATGIQPDPRQAHKGTVVHRRWEGEKASALAGDGFFDIDVQRQEDGLEDGASFALVVTLEMPGENQVYTQVLNRVALKPAVRVQAGT